MSPTKAALSKQAAKAPGADKPASRVPGSSPVLELQQSLGNQELGRLLRNHQIQAKLAVNHPGDVYEREADRVAQEVVFSPALPAVQRKCACGGAAGAGGECEECRKKEEGLVQRKTEGDSGPATAPPVVHEVLGSSGQPLDPTARAFLEPRFGHSFGDVRVHTGERAAEAARSVDALAFTVGRDVVFGSGQYTPGTPDGKRLLAHELTHVVQQASASADASALSPTVAPQLRSGLSLRRRDAPKQQQKASPAPAKDDPKLLKDFAAQFSAAADLVRKSPEAMKLVAEADAAGVKFGGYAEEGPGKDAWPYTIGDTVYVPKASTDKVLAMSGFLFELNNAIRKPKFAKLFDEAAKGKLTPQKCAYQIVEQEVEGMLRLGQIWFEAKKTIGKGATWDKYDNAFYLSEYQAFKAGKKTKGDIVKEVLKRKYTSGKDKGKTVEQYYVEVCKK